MKKNLESAYHRALLARLCLEHGRRLLFFRRNVGFFQLEDGRGFKAGVKGQADIEVFGAGFHGEIEVKRKSELNPSQLAWRDRCREMGIPWLMVRVVEGEHPAATVERWAKEVRQWLSGSGARI